MKTCRELFIDLLGVTMIKMDSDYFEHTEDSVKNTYKQNFIFEN